MRSEEWTEADVSRAKDAFDRHFAKGKGMSIWTAEAETARDWAGSARGLSSLDTRIQFKNNAEYHGMERHAWQYLVTVQYIEAADYFYAAALWREVDGESISGANPGAPDDPGHLKAIEICIRMGRFCDALQKASKRRFSAWPSPENFGLKSSMVEAREKRAEKELDASG